MPMEEAPLATCTRCGTRCAATSSRWMLRIRPRRQRCEQRTILGPIVRRAQLQTLCSPICGAVVCLSRFLVQDAELIKQMIVLLQREEAAAQVCGVWCRLRGLLALEVQPCADAG